MVAAQPEESVQGFEITGSISSDENDSPESATLPSEISNVDELVVGIERDGEASEILPTVGKYEKEIESIQFYVDNDYRELAEKALSELSEEFGETEAIASLRAKINGAEPAHIKVEARSFGIDEIRSEFGLEEGEVNDDDYDTHYHTAVAYQEMGLYEQAISEFQDAINLVKADDGTRRFFGCANLLGHCFMQNGHANSAAMWFQRALETPALNDHEKEGLWYELALAFEADGDVENAAKLFESIYAENVDFRDVGARVKNLLIAR